MENNAPEKSGPPDDGQPRITTRQLAEPLMRCPDVKLNLYSMYVLIAGFYPIRFPEEPLGGGFIERLEAISNDRAFQDFLNRMKEQ